MKGLYLLFFVLALISVQIFGVDHFFTFEQQSIFALVLIGLLGIPHGAIDHVMYTETGGKNIIQFYTKYLALLGGMLIIWYFSETLGFIIFLIVSALHFGQSQFYDLRIENFFSRTSMAVLWGLAMLSSLFTYGFAEIDFAHIGSTELETWKQNMGVSGFLIIQIFSNVAIVMVLIILFLKGKTNRERFLSELLVLVLFHLICITLPPVIAFTLYFVGIHSLGSLISEYKYVLSTKKIGNFRSFLLLLLPYTLLSIGGVTLIYFVQASLSGLNISTFNLLFSFIAALTIPHALVMNRYYVKFSRKLH